LLVTSSSGPVTVVLPVHCLSDMNARLGARPTYRLFNVTLPLIAPYLTLAILIGRERVPLSAAGRRA
jgi:hypothetical protein